MGETLLSLAGKILDIIREVTVLKYVNIQTVAKHLKNRYQTKIITIFNEVTVAKSIWKSNSCDVNVEKTSLKYAERNITFVMAVPKYYA